MSSTENAMTTCEPTCEPPRSLSRPRSAVHETPEAWTFLLDLPGVDPEAVQVTLEQGILKVTAERDLPAPDGYECLTPRLGARTFERAFRVRGARAQEVSARLAEGRLTVRVPKAAPERRRIEVRTP